MLRAYQFSAHTASGFRMVARPRQRRFDCLIVFDFFDFAGPSVRPD
jgi:hypothetical protein